METDPSIKSGTLYIAATPIGNLGDMSERLYSLLKTTGIVASEDTRVSLKLLTLAGSKARCISLHKFNEKRSSEEVIRLLKQGETVTLVSDAGTPAISDPGYLLVNAAHEAGIEVIALPGPSAVIAACSISGFDCSRFFFAGFLPRKEQEITELLQIYSEYEGAFVFFETPHRLKETLLLMEKILEDSARICLCKEISKKFEGVFRGRISEVISKLDIKGDPLGEWTCLIERIYLRKQVVKQESREISVQEVMDYFKVNRNKASKILSIITGQLKQDLYRK